MKEKEGKRKEWGFRRVAAGVREGLTAKQVQERVLAGADNKMVGDGTLSVGKIIRKNVFTLFNAINLMLAVAVIWVGAVRQALFFGIAVANTLMGIFQELRAKRTLDELAILARGKATVVRSGKEIRIDQGEVVVDDILVLRTGNQVVADGEVVEAEYCEVDESLLTGEADAVRKEAGDEVLSGSFVVSGEMYMRVMVVGQESYAGQLAHEAKRTKKATAPLMHMLNKIIKVLAVVIIPMGVMLFYQQYDGSGDLRGSVVGATAAMVGMIPEGLVLLTGITMTLGAVKLARQKALVQSLPSIETLARVDVLCLDKTGTITDGELDFDEILPAEGRSREEMARVLAEMMAALKDENATAEVLRGEFPDGGEWGAKYVAPFSSEKKWSGVRFENGNSYVLGAPSFVLSKIDAETAGEIAKYTERGERVLLVAESKNGFRDGALPTGLSLVGLVVLVDHIRPEAEKTFRIFRKEGVDLKVISGDDAQTVSAIAGRVKIAGAEKFLDMSEVETEDYADLVREYTVFGRVKPEQKKMLVMALKAAGHTVCMTGDGVNDVLALKEANCGVAMINGSDAARAAADFVLMTGDFSAMVDVLREGRRVINNIELVASLYLVKTMYSAVLSLLYMVIPYPYPFSPLQMTPINGFVVGIPSFFLAFRGLYEKPKGRFVANVLEGAMPAAVVIVVNILLVQLLGVWFGWSQEMTSTMNVVLTATVGFGLLFKVSQPLTTPYRVLLWAVIVAFAVCLVVFRGFFGFVSLWQWGMLVCVPLMWVGVKISRWLMDKMRILIRKYERRRRHG